jgi:hypothetical protein
MIPTTMAREANLRRAIITITPRMEADTPTTIQIILQKIATLIPRLEDLRKSITEFPDRRKYNFSTNSFHQ